MKPREWTESQLKTVYPVEQGLRMNPNELTLNLTRLDSIRRRTLAAGEDSGPQSYLFREGADPEMHQGDNPDALADLLAAKARMYVANLGYESESIGILCSRTTQLAMSRGMDVVDRFEGPVNQ